MLAGDTTPVIELSRGGLRRLHPGDTEEENALRFAAVHYGEDVAAEDTVLAKLEWYRRVVR